MISTWTQTTLHTAIQNRFKESIACLHTDKLSLLLLRHCF